MSSEITMYAKFDGKCTDCGYKIDKGAAIKYNTASRTAKHVKCPEPDYSGDKQRNIFEMWIERAKETEVLQEKMRERRKA
jgi:hypothetical protein